MPSIILPSRFPRWPVGCVLLLLLLLAGCAHVKPGAPQGLLSEGQPDDPYARSDLDELLGFGSALDGQNPSAWAEVCRVLLKRQQEPPPQATQTGIQLHLMTARLFSDACGDITKILDGVDAIPVADISDGRVRQWVAVQTQALKRVDSLSKRLGTLEHKQEQSPRHGHASGPKGSKSPNKSKSAKPSKHGESRALRDKLESIRYMEMRLDETAEHS